MEIFAKYSMWFITYSFFGWVYETILCSVTQKKFVNRGFLNGPICPIYGFGAICVIIVLGKGTQNVIGLFLSGAMLTCTLEYFTSWLMEKLFHARWWDYSKRKFQLNGRVCLEGAIVFGLFAVVLIKLIHPALSSFYDRHLDVYQQIFISGGIIALLAVDIFVTVKHLLNMNGRLEMIQNFIEKEKAAKIERINTIKQDMKNKLGADKDFAKLGIKLNFQDKRLLNAFPNLKSTKYYQAMEKLREMRENLASNNFTKKNK